MMGILQVKLVTILVLLKLGSGSAEIDKKKYYKSLTSEERLRIFNTDDENHIPNFAFATVDWPEQHKQSTDEVYPARLRAPGIDITLNLRLITPLVGPNTPVYIMKTQNRKPSYEVNYPFTVPINDVYEDERYVTTVIVETLADGSKRIIYGLIGSYNAIIQEAPKPVQFSSRPGSSMYIVHFVNALNDIFGTNIIAAPTYTATSEPPKLPNVIYPEILIMADYSLYNTFPNFNSFAKYLMFFWNSVDFMYRPINNPKYKLSIAGIVVAQDATAFSFISDNLISRSINYNNTLNSLYYWLSIQEKNFPPLNNYDVIIVQTRITANDPGARKLGLAYIAGACNSVPSKRAGIIYDQIEYSSVYTAAHELGHLLGAYHDDGCIGGKSVMASATSPFNTGRLRWSQCAINGFGDFLKQQPQCLFNIPSHLQGLNLKPTSPKYNVTYDIKNKAVILDEELLKYERELMEPKARKKRNSPDEGQLDYARELTEEEMKKYRNSRYDELVNHERELMEPKARKKRNSSDEGQFNYGRGF